MVDDDLDVRTMISVALCQVNGYTVQLCGSSVEALEHARSFRPELILLDVMMPGLDGPETLKVLRGDESTAAIPIVFMSAGIDGHDAPRYKRIGAQGVIPKPFDPAALPANLQRFLGAQAIEDAGPTDLPDLRPAYLSELPEKLAAMEAAAASLATGGWDKPTVEELFHLAHRMAGSAGLFGLDGLAQAAGILASMLKRVLQYPPWPPARSAAEVTTLVKAVVATAPGRTLGRSARRPPARAGIFGACSKPRSGWKRTSST